jgi:zinc transport system substrate-binding protein
MQIICFMKKTLTFALLLAVTLAVLSFWAFDRSRPKSIEAPSEKIIVAASFYPLAEFTTRIGGERIAVLNLTPPGIEPHDFEPSPQQITATYAAKLFVYNGGAIDAWAGLLAPSLRRRGATILVMDTLMDSLLPAISEDNDEKELFDEHFWLDPLLAIKQVAAIRDALIAIDPEHAGEYRANAGAYTRDLRALDREFSGGLASCTMNTAITSHAAFAYLAKRYGFIQLPIAGLSPDEEPSAGKLAEITREARRLGVKHVFFETLASPALTKTLADEIGGGTLVFNPLEGLTPEEATAGKNYLTIMRENLANLRIALQCR